MLRRNTDAVDDDDAEAVARAGNLGARAHEQRVMASRAASMARSAVAANLGATGRQQKRRTLLSADERAVANEARRMKRRRQLDAVLQRVHVQHGHGMQSTTTTTSQAAAPAALSPVALPPAVTDAAVEQAAFEEAAVEQAAVEDGQATIDEAAVEEAATAEPMMQEPPGFAVAATPPIEAAAPLAAKPAAAISTPPTSTLLQQRQRHANALERYYAAMDTVRTSHEGPHGLMEKMASGRPPRRRCRQQRSRRSARTARESRRERAMPRARAECGSSAADGSGDGTGAVTFGCAWDVLGRRASL